MAESRIEQAQAKEAETGQVEEDLSEKYVWDLFVRIFHWSLVVAFSVAFYYRESEWDRLIHVNAGYVVAGLLLARIIWGFMKTRYASFHAFPLNPIHAAKYLWRFLHGRGRRFIGHNPAGSVIIYTMLFCGLTTVVSGYLVYNDGWLFDDPGYLAPLHYYSSWAWMILVVIHVIGVITESILHRDNLIKAMITGCKRSSRRTEKSYWNKDSLN
jgi:cytochrome b